MRAIDLPAHPSGHAAPVTHVAFRADGRRLASCSYDGTVVIWDVTDPDRPRRVNRLQHRRLVNAAAWNPVAGDLLATASADKTAAVWRVADGRKPQLLTVLARHTDDINAVAWMPDGHHLICVSEDGHATLWNGLSGAFVSEVGSHGAHCMMVSVSRTGLIATVGEDGVVAVSDPRPAGGRTTRTYPTSIEGCAWSHSGDVLAVARDDGAVDLLAPDLRILRTIEVSASATRSVAWSGDDARLVVGAYDGSVHVFDPEGRRHGRIQDARIWPRSVDVHGPLVATGSFWSAPHLFDLATGAVRSAPAAANHGPNALVADGDTLVVGTDSGLVVAMDLTDSPSPPTARILARSDSPVMSLAVEAGVVFAGTYGGRVLRCDGTGLISEPLGSPVPSLCRTAAGLVAGTYNGELIRLDPGTLQVRDRGRPHDGSVKSLAPFRDGFLSASTDRTVGVGTLGDRSILLRHGNLVNAVAALQDRVVASASRDHTVQVVQLDVDRGTGAALRRQVLLGPDESVKTVGLLGEPATPIVLAGSYDFGLYAWHVDWADENGSLTGGRLIHQFGQGVSCMAKLDDRRIAVAGWDGQIVIAGPDRDGTVRVLRVIAVDESAARSPVEVA